MVSTRRRKSRPSKSKTPRSPKVSRKNAPGKYAVQTIKEQTKALQKSIERITKEMEKVSDKSYETMMKRAAAVWKKEFGEDLKEPLLSQLVMSFLNEKMKKEYVKLVRKQMAKRNKQRGGGETPQGVVEFPFNEFKTYPTDLPSAYHGNFTNALQLYDHPAESVGTCGGSLMDGGVKGKRRGKGKMCTRCGKPKRRGGKRRDRTMKQRGGGGYNPFPLSLPHYFPATVAQSYSPPATDYLAAPSSFVRGYFDILNGSEFPNLDPATNGSLGDAPNSVLNEPNTAMDPNFVPVN